MQILLIEPFFSGSHRQWALGLQQFSRHQVHLLSLPGRHWKWRMHGAAVSLARQFLAADLRPDLILVSDMLDLAVFLGLCRQKCRNIPVALYFHENQITYPWSPNDQDPQQGRNHHYGFINYTSALAADRLFFNSGYHQKSFFAALGPFLAQFPDHREADLIGALEAKSEVLPLGLDLQALDISALPERPAEPVLLWNHRWEYDKNPEEFFEVMQLLSQRGHAFRLIVLGESFRHSPAVFEQARSALAAHILHYGYAMDREDYARLLWTADLIPVTSRQDFFGISAVEAMYCGCYPLLPDRLAFPEHIPPPERLQHLYTDRAGLVQQLELLLPQVATLRANRKYRNFVAHYDWRILAAEYDRCFESQFCKTTT